MMPLIRGNINCQPALTMNADILNVTSFYEENVSAYARKHYFLILLRSELTNCTMKWEIFVLWDAEFIAG